MGLIVGLQPSGGMGRFYGLTSEREDLEMLAVNPLGRYRDNYEAIHYEASQAGQLVIDKREGVSPWVADLDDMRFGVDNVLSSDYDPNALVDLEAEETTETPEEVWINGVALTADASNHFNYNHVHQIVRELYVSNPLWTAAKTIPEPAFYM